MFLLFLSLFLVAIFAGFFGALVGIGGGIVIVPVLTLVFHMPIHHAIAASIVSVIATSIAGALSYVDQQITNVRLGMFLEIATTGGALIGAFVGVMMQGWVLSLIFGALIMFMAVVSYRSRETDDKMIAADSFKTGGVDKISRKLDLQGEYHDEAANREVSYHATRAIEGGLVSSLAGIGSGLLGIGGGVIKVAAMNSMMNVPMKVSVATSKFMIGVTAATSAIVYLLAGAVNLYIVGPVALGTMLGATIGSNVMNKLHSKVIKIIFFVIMIYLGFSMLANGLRSGAGIKFPTIL